MYIGCAILTCLLAYRSNKLLLSSKKKNVRRGNFLMLLISIIFSVVAGLRDYTVGTDISYYALPSFINAQRFDLATYFAVDGSALEPLYMLLNYFVVKIFNNIGVLLFALQMITAVFVLFRLCDYKETNKLWLGVLIYNFFFFPISLNIMRQSIAMAMVFYATRYLFGSNSKLSIKRYLIIVAISIGFHGTGAVGIAVLFFYMLFFRETRGEKDRYLILKSVTLIVILIVVVILFDKVVDLIVPISSFTGKFSRYTDQSFGGLDINPLLVRLPYIVLPLLFWNRYKKERTENYLLFMLILTDLVFSELRAYSTSLYRVSYYFAYFRMLAIPTFVQSLEIRNRKIMSLIICVLCIVIWAYQIVYQGNESVYPYVFRN